MTYTTNNIVRLRVCLIVFYGLNYEPTMSMVRSDALAATVRLLIGTHNRGTITA